MGKIIAKDPKRAAAHIYAELTARYPQGVFEAFLHAKGDLHEWHETGALSTLMPRIIRFCAEFPEAVIQFDPEHPYGIVSVITCDCSEVDASPCAEKCKGPKEHPKAFLRLVNDGLHDVVVGSRAVTPPDETKPAV